MASITKCYSLPSTNTSTRHIQKISQFSNIAFQYQKTHRDTWSAEKFCETAASKNNVKRQFGPKTECSLRLWLCRFAEWVISSVCQAIKSFGRAQSGFSWIFSRISTDFWCKVVLLFKELKDCGRIYPRVQSSFGWECSE